jgi:DNA-binding PadR family transcriptional regulator
MARAKDGVAAPRKTARRPAEVPAPLNATAASLLGFLANGPLTGWELMVQVENVIGDFWNVTRSQIYRELKVLAAQGLVETMKAGSRDKQPYRVTAAGMDAFRQWIAQEPGPPIMRVPLVLSVFFGEYVPFEEMTRSFAKLRAYHADRLEVYRGFLPGAPKGTWPHEALRMGLRFQEGMIAWIDSLPKRPLEKPRKPRT